ncbi:Pyridine nucleotide-disulfide oxidoreductase OS=Streptomyces antimycoticus OX=68175 GN=ykgC PE=3 SV=1 [Streptomyces antimycoticus]
MGTTNRSLQADLLVIGFGKGGKTVAATLGKLGRRVVMVERSAKMYGGTCPNVGWCADQGTGPPLPQAPPCRTPHRSGTMCSIAEVQALTKAFRGENYDALDGMDTVTVLTGAAAFADPHTVRVECADGPVTITAERSASTPDRSRSFSTSPACGPASTP